MLIIKLITQEVYKVSQLQCIVDPFVMVTHLYLGVIILAGLTTANENADVQLFCDKDSVAITWRIDAELVPYGSRLFLGSCRPSKLNVLPSGEGEAQFNYKFADCKFAKLLKGKNLIYQNELTFRPQAKSKPASILYPIKCVYKRPETWVPPFLNPGSGVSEGRGGLVVHMALLNEQLTAVAKTNVIPLGSFIPIWAAVEEHSHQPLLLLMEECVAAPSAVLQPSSQVYPIITNKGCLLDSKRGNSVFLPRYHSSAIILYLQSFKFPVGEEVYVHCKLVVWDPDVFNESKKACNYVKESGRWELLDDPFQSSLCDCCDSTCKSHSKRAVKWESNSESHSSVLGPLIIVEHNSTAVVLVNNKD